MLTFQKYLNMLESAYWILGMNKDIHFRLTEIVSVNLGLGGEPRFEIFLKPKQTVQSIDVAFVKRKLDH